MVEPSIKFAAEYQHDGEKWALNFYAIDERDATAKLASIKRTLTLLGQTVALVPAESFVIQETILAQ